MSMSEYRQVIKMLFRSWSKTHELSSRIVDEEIRRKQFKWIETNYRVHFWLKKKFQNEVTRKYGSKEEIDLGLMRHYHH